MGDAFDDMAELNPFMDPAVVAAANANTEQQVPRLGMAPSNEEQTKPVDTEKIVWSIQPQEETKSVTESVQNRPSDFNVNIDELTRREEELRKKEIDLDVRQSQFVAERAAAPKIPNFPPFPSWCPLQPCFYINISDEIPPGHRLLVRRLYIKLFVLTIILMVNVLAVGLQLGSKVNGATVGFVLSIIIFLTQPAASFLFCFRSAYHAMRSKSSFYFILFFISFAIEIIIHVVQMLGIQGNGYAGFINGATCIDTDSHVAGYAGIIMGFAFASLLCVSVYMIREVYIVYKMSGANLQQAQSEFTSGVWKHGSSALFSSATTS